MWHEYGKPYGFQSNSQSPSHVARRNRERDMAEFTAYWHSKRRNSDVPRRSDIDPRGIEAMLPNAFVAERVAPGLARLRIAGTHLADLMGMEVRGMPLSALIETDDRAQLSEALVELFERPAIIRLTLAAQGGFRRAELAGTLLILPLRSDLGDTSRALGCLVTQGNIGNTPRRLRISSCQMTRIDLPGADASVGPQASGFAELASPFEPEQALASERPYLRLIR